MRVIWWVLSVLIILSMLLLFGPISPYATPSQPAPQVNTPGDEVELTEEGYDADDLEANLQF